MQKKLRWRIVLVASLACAIIFLALIMQTPSQTPPRNTGYGEAKIGGEFHLVDTRGRMVSDADFRGRLMLVYMGYSHCPDICPMTLATIGDALKALGPDSDKVAALFISLDPERDTPAALASYLTAFDSRITGLTGSKEEIAQAAGAYRVFYKKSPTPNTGSYLIDHAGFLYLMDAHGKYITHFDTGVKTDDLVKAIRDHL